MNIGEILVWESSNLLLLIPVVIGLVILVEDFLGVTRIVYARRSGTRHIGIPFRSGFVSHRLTSERNRHTSSADGLIYD